MSYHLVGLPVGDVRATAIRGALLRAVRPKDAAPTQRRVPALSCNGRIRPRCSIQMRKGSLHR